MPPAKPEPGRDPEMAQRTQVLNVVFALSSIALLLTLSLMIWYDYDREWKHYQLKYTDLDVKRTQTQIEEALGKVDAAKRAQLEQQLQQSKQEAAANREAAAKAEKELGRLE